MDKLAEFALEHQIDTLCQLDYPRELSSQIKASQLSDSLDNLLIDDSVIDVSTKFIPDPAAHALFFMRIKASGVVLRECQRCLEPVIDNFSFAVNWQVMRAIIPDMEIKQGYEVMAIDEYLGIVELFTQEIILSLATIPLHIEKKCFLQQGSLVDNAALKLKAANHHNQFAALAMLTNRQTSGEN